MTNNTTHQRVLTQHALREYTQQRQAATTVSAANDSPAQTYPCYADEVLSYTIFHNPTCQYHSASMLLNKNLSDDYCRRWLYFHVADIKQLPHIPYAAELFAATDKLRQQLHAQQAPRLALFSLVFIVIVFLTARGHFLLAALPILLITMFWLHTDKSIQRQQENIIKHNQALLDLRAQYWRLQEQLDYLPPPAEPSHFQQQFKRTIQLLLSQTANSLLHPHELNTLIESLRKRQWHIFGLSTWGVLQIPFQANTELVQWFFKAENTLAAALQPATKKHAATYRLTYLQFWILTEKGVLISHAFYERVTDQCLQIQQEFIAYTQIAAFEITQALLPEHEKLKNLLPDDLYHAHFQRPSTILTLQTKRGTRWQCATHFQNHHLVRLANDDTLQQMGVNTDLTALERLLHERLYMQQAV